MVSRVGHWSGGSRIDVIFRTSTFGMACWCSPCSAPPSIARDEMQPSFVPCGEVSPSKKFSSASSACFVYQHF
eukprot:3062832-Rhodomonas_salina.2